MSHEDTQSGCGYEWSIAGLDCVCQKHELSEGPTRPVVWHVCKCGSKANLALSETTDEEVARLRALASEAAAALPTARFAKLRDSLLELAEEARRNDAVPASELAQVAQAAALCHIATWGRDES